MQPSGHKAAVTVKAPRGFIAKLVLKPSRFDVWQSGNTSHEFSTPLNPSSETMFALKIFIVAVVVSTCNALAVDKGMLTFPRTPGVVVDDAFDSSCRVPRRQVQLW